MHPELGWIDFSFHCPCPAQPNEGSTTICAGQRDPKSGSGNGYASDGLSFLASGGRDVEPHGGLGQEYVAIHLGFVRSRSTHRSS